MYKCASVGVSGSRARGHAEAYSHVRRGRLVAVSTRRRESLDAFADEYDVPARYTDYREMFSRERPDLVHVNTPPDVRLEIFEAAEEAGVPTVIVEKPLAVQWEDFLAIHRFAQRAKVKIAVNHQLHFHPRRQTLQKLVREGGIGEVRFIDASARMNMAYQGTHTLQAIGAFQPDVAASSVFGQVSGAEGLQENPKRHYAPDHCVASIAYPNGVHALLRCGPSAPLATDRESIAMHKRIAVHGTRGFVRWTMFSCETGRDGKIESGRHDYFEEDVLGQAAMTDAMLDWIEDDAKVHPLNIHNALREFHIVLNIYMSALRREVRPLADPPGTPPQPNLIDEMRRQLAQA